MSEEQVKPETLILENRVKHPANGILGLVEKPRLFSPKYHLKHWILYLTAQRNHLEELLHILMPRSPHVNSSRSQGGWGWEGLRLSTFFLSFLGNVNVQVTWRTAGLTVAVYLNAKVLAA